jgi:hypothetical protein
MSAIDSYKHKHLGFIECPSTFDIVYSNPTRKVGIYELLENIPSHENNFDGKVGDIILGGGSGEVPAFRISLPDTIYFFTKDEWDEFNNYDDLFKVFWTPTQSYVLCEGYSKLGWTRDTQIEFWLARNLCLLIIDKLDSFEKYKSKMLSTSELTFFNIDEY